MMNFETLVCIFFIGFTLRYAVASIPRPGRNATFPQSEMYALEALYNSTSGYQWHWNAIGTRWNFTGYHNPCSEDWQGITCSCNGDINSACHVIQIDLRNYRLRGNLPSLKNLTGLEDLSFETNFLTSSIPSDFVCWDVLIRLQMPDNFLTGSIPDGLWQNGTQLETINLNYNFIDGTFPKSVNSLPLLTNVLVSNNMMHGLVPNFGSSEFLVDLELDYNAFDGPFNQTFTSVFFVNLLLQNNQFTGTLSSMFKNHTSAQILNIAYNHFSGPIDFLEVHSTMVDFVAAENLFSGPMDSICHSAYWKELYLDYNLFTGTIPDCVGAMTDLAYLLVNNNQMTGTIPQSIGSLNKSFLLSFEAGHNKLTGPIPDLTKLHILEYVLLQGNMLTGNVFNLIASSYTTSLLVFVDLSDNRLTGSLPEEIFELKYLASLSVATNCLDSFIPSNVCNRSTLEFLDLDGMGAADVCQNRFFPGVPYLTAYGLTSANQGGIPECLFSMKHLNTLHLSGNAIEGTLSHDLEIGVSLIDLSLSHNNLRGLIPLSLQQNPSWTNLDLSFNKFSGVLDSEFQANPVNSTITLQVNRLSGHIPHSLKDVKNINILSGNMFYCRLNRDSLPTHDTSYHSYQCGSSTFNQSMVAWGVLCLIMLIVVGLAMYAVFGGNSSSSSSSSSSLEYIRGCVKTGQKYLAMFDAEHNSSNHHTDMGELYNFGIFLRKLRQFFLQLSAVACLLLLPLYVVLKVFYSNTTHVYAWIVSASYLSGLTPAVVLMVVWSVLLLVIFVAFLNKTPRLNESSNSQVPKLDDNSQDTTGKRFNLSHWSQSAVVVLLNCISITAFNGCYVYIVFEYNATIITLSQIAVALSKLLWNFLIVMLCKHLHMSHAVKVHFLTFVVLFNSIIAPLLANAALDPNCFKNVLVAAEDVTSSFPITNCNPILLASTNSSCGSDVNPIKLQTSFQPPFIYSYECSSSFVTNYSSVYVFMFLFVSFLSPLFLVGIDKYLVAYKTNPSAMYKRVEAMYYTLMKDPQPLESVLILFDNDVFLLKTVSKLSIFMTLGVVFPPLAVVVTVAFVVDSLTNQLMIGRFLYRMEDSSTRSLYRDVIAREVRGSSSSLGNSMLKLILPFAALFYSFFLFDTYGDAAGTKQALWCTILMAVMPLMIWCGYWIVRRASTCSLRTDHTDRTQGSVELSVCDESGAVKRLKHSLVAENTARNPLVI